MKKRVFAVALALVLSLSSQAFFAPQADSADSQETAQITLGEMDFVAEGDYGTYYSDYSDWQIASNDLPTISNISYNTEYTFSVPENALYEIWLTYTDTQSAGSQYSIEIDGTVPFEHARFLSFPTVYKDADNKRFDGSGNEISPEQIAVTQSVTMPAREYTGVSEDYYRFALSKGTHTVALHRNYGQGIVTALTFRAPEAPATYQKPKAEKNNNTIKIAAEKAVLKTGRSLVPMCDASHAEVQPSDPVRGKLNYIGGSNWSSPGDTITWKFKVKKAGYYSFGAHYRQNINIGAVSYRSLRIDGQLPFAEAKRVKFTYSPSWQYFDFGNPNGDPYLFWLDEGEHELSLAVTSGEMAQSYTLLKQIASDLGDLYVDITMIVGETVDINRSYELFEQIPDFNQRLESAVSSLKKLSRQMEVIQEKQSGSTVSTIQSAIETLQKMIDNPYSAHQYKSAYYTAYTNLGALVGTIPNMPLDIDTIYLYGSGASAEEDETSFWDKTTFSAKRFLKTFSEDYSSVSADATKEGDLTLWVNWGRDQAQVLTALIQESFTPKTGINVCVKVVNATLIQGILSGKGPDCILHMPRTEPVNLAMRGALVPLSQFDDCEQVLSQFNADGAVPYTYNNKVYALPDTQTFQMLFVRTDILNRMGLEVPTTWEEFANVTTTLQRSNLQVCIPQTMYPTFLAQAGLPLYDLEKGVTTLTQTEQILCFNRYTDWYVKYKVPKAMSLFFDRFRIGAAPMGIADFTMITQLVTAAPEIENRWKAVQLPGTVREDGKTYSLSAGGGTGCAITKLSKSPENAWEFLKWWVSADTQQRYSDNLESVIGPLGRVATSNVEAFGNLGWDADSLDALKAQQKDILNFEELPGGYYVNRSIDQAFWNVVEANANVNDTMIKWGNIADMEMQRKKAEYANKK
ncbi:MAG: extracellular solute-binding protein [Clostridia bacterium]|nr:extracellular solute-binding protein [Clostridia bacterium]